MMYMQEMLSNMSRAIIRFNRAKCRSRKVNLLERKLALIPICEHAHWYTQVYNLHVFPRGGNLTGTSGDIGAENWDMRGFSTFFRFFL